MDDALARAMDAYVDARLEKLLGPLLARLDKIEGSFSTAPSPPRTTRLGTNLVRPVYYEPVWAFVDLMKASHVNGQGLVDYSWIQPAGTAPLPLSPDGWPLGMPGGVYAHTAVAKMGGHYPAGKYRLDWDGEGAVTLSGDATGTYAAPPSYPVVTPTAAGIDIKVIRSTTGNPLRNLRLLMPDVPEDATFHPKFVESLAAYSVLRFMDWGATNNSGQVAWTDRTLPSRRSQVKGVAYEHMIALCNLLKADPWVCIPHQASSSYVEAMAELFKTQLDPTLKVWLELSNEVWNGAFGQRRYFENLSTTENVQQSYARVAVGHFKTWERVWGSRSRLVRVLAGQAANPDVGKQTLTAAGAGNYDALAVAPYFGGNLGSVAAVAGWSVDQVIAACQDDLDVQRARMVANKAVADAAGVPLVAYEGGQHLAGTVELREDPDLVELFTAANRDPRMEALYRTYLGHWAAIGGGLFCHFNDCYAPKKYGAWGALEWQDQPMPPKQRALVATAAAWRMEAERG